MRVPITSKQGGKKMLKKNVRKNNKISKKVSTLLALQMLVSSTALAAGTPGVSELSKLTYGIVDDIGPILAFLSLSMLAISHFFMDGDNMFGKALKRIGYIGLLFLSANILSWLFGYSF